MSGLMIRIRKQARAIPFDIDSSDALAQSTFGRNPEAESAIQYLAWALESIEKAGSEKAGHHTRAAIAALRNGGPKSDRAW